MENKVVDAIKQRRTVKAFSDEPITDEQLQLILDSGIWAPSWLNIQPWKFIVITDPEIKSGICSHVPLMEKAGIRDAPVCIGVCVEEYNASSHLAEDGASATYAMSLAAYSLGLGTYWVGIYDRMKRKNSMEKKLAKLLSIPSNYRLISLMPVGKPRKTPESKRKGFEEVVCYNEFSDGRNGAMSAEQMLRKRLTVEKEISFSDQIDPPTGNI
jgi:nitroreductase